MRGVRRLFRLWIWQLQVAYVSWAARMPHSSPSVRMPEQVDVVEGLVANVDVVMAGGAAEPADPSSSSNTSYSVPTRTNRAIIDWERSDDNGASWRVIAHSYQNEAIVCPPAWAIRGATGASATVSWPPPPTRVRCCDSMPAIHRRRRPRRHPAYTAPHRGSTSCSRARCPTIVDAPHSMLVRTGQTANLVRNRFRPARAYSAMADTPRQLERRTGAMSPPATVPRRPTTPPRLSCWPTTERNIAWSPPMPWEALRALP